MARTYSTGEIIDILKPGQKAVCVDGFYNKDFIERKEHGIYFGGGPDHLQLTRGVLESKWQLLPQYVTFEEALKAWREGKKIRVEWSHDDEPNDWEEFQDYPRESKISFYQIMDGKWSILEDSQ